ncbi:hypothetical protein VB773_21500 [Haloarculaceae archaeon H-GB2-1]|nr:hypothetical protein [Haloarculaceae archaeon H-GB11]MEA5409889.1 hypothetical protein [Haloarculaceae archaeon H-GB2-1]
MLVTGTVAVGYLIIGGLLIAMNSPLAPESFLSLENDPYFYLSTAVASIFTIQATGSLILYKFLTGVEDQRSQFVILMSYIGLGFGEQLSGLPSRSLSISFSISCEFQREQYSER